MEAAAKGRHADPGRRERENLPGGRWQAFARDISEARRGAREREELLAREQLARRQAETASQKLRESEERFRLTIDEAPIGMALVDLDGRFARVNAALCEIIGYTAHELERLRFQDITHRQDLDSDLALLGRLLRGEIPRYQLEKRYIRKDGSVVPILLSTSILRGPDGAAVYYIAQIEDITERKRVEQRLKESEAKFSGIVSIAGDAIISIDEQRRITIFNRGAEHILVSLRRRPSALLWKVSYLSCSVKLTVRTSRASRPAT